MEPYERVLKSVRHQLPDRLPIDYLSTPEADRNLKTYLKIEDDEALQKKLGFDLRRVTEKFVGPENLCGGAGVNAVGRDFWGVVWKPQEYGLGTYNEIAFHPLAEAKTVKEIKDYAWPKLDWFDFACLKEKIARINREERYAILFFAGGAFETPWYLRGMERFLMDLVECPEIAETIIDCVVDFYLQRTLRAIEESDGKIDIVYSGGDIGTQKGMMLSPDLWRKHIKPYSTKLIRTFKDMGLITYYHSCGSIKPVINDFIEMGLDILDPIQPKAFDMEPEKLKREFGDRLTFHGGIDVQELLPFGKPEDIKKEVNRLMGILGSGGGYIVCPAHSIQPDTPPENILALYEAARHFRKT